MAAKLIQYCKVKNNKNNNKILKNKSNMQTGKNK